MPSPLTNADVRNGNAMDRCAQYRQRLADYLPTLPSDDARVSFLRQQSRSWQQAYAEFRDRIDGGMEKPGKNTPTAFEYLQTISDIDALIFKYGGMPKREAA